MNRRMKMVIAATTAALTAGAAGCSGGEGGSGHGEGTLVMGDSFSLTHPIGSNGTEQFIEGLETRGGDVGLDLQYFASGQLGKQWDMPTVVRTGVADISVISPSYVASEMPLSSVGDLAGLVEDACVASYALKDLMFEGGILYEEEFKPLNIRPLWIGVIPAYEAMTSERPVAVPGDLEGTVQRSTGGAQDRIVDAGTGCGVMPGSCGSGSDEGHTSTSAGTPPGWPPMSTGRCGRSSPSRAPWTRRRPVSSSRSSRRRSGTSVTCTDVC